MVTDEKSLRPEIVYLLIILLILFIHVIFENEVCARGGAGFRAFLLG